MPRTFGSLVSKSPAAVRTPLCTFFSPSWCAFSSAALQRLPRARGGADFSQACDHVFIKQLFSVAASHFDAVNYVIPGVTAEVGQVNNVEALGDLTKLGIAKRHLQSGAGRKGSGLSNGRNHRCQAPKVFQSRQQSRSKRWHSSKPKATRIPSSDSDASCSFKRSARNTRSRGEVWPNFAVEKKQSSPNEPSPCS